MLKNYLKIAYRNFTRHLGYSLINVLGLSIGIACTLLILLYIGSELSFDRYHKNYDRIYRVIGNVKFEGVGEESASMAFPAGPALVQDYPDLVEQAVRFYNFQAPTLNVEYGTDGSKRFNESRFFLADSNIFKVFSYEFVKGNPEIALNNPNTVIVTESTAKKYFANDDPMGKILKFENRVDLEVTGVIKDVPENSHFIFDFLASFSTVKNFYGGRIPPTWYWNPCWTYILLKENVTPEMLKTQFPNVVQKYYPEMIRNSSTIDLQPLTDIHLYSNRDFEIAPNSDVSYIYIFAAVAVFVLLVAGINFLNLATARSANRAREVGLRKVLGAERRELIVQFIFESVAVCIMSAIIAVIMVVLILPWFKSFTNTAINSKLLFESNFILLLIITPIVIGFLAGIYPAFFLSAFQPVKVLKGSLSKGAKSSLFRKALVISQFALSTILIIGTLIAFDQLEFMRNKKLGFDKDQVVLMQVYRTDFNRWYNSFRDRVLQNENIVNVTSMEDVIGAKYQSGNYVPEGSLNQKGHQIPRLVVNFDFTETFGLEIVSGRSFSRDFPADTVEGTLLNESAVKLFGWTNEEAVGKYLSYEGMRVKVTGVVKDFNYTSLHSEITPFVLELPHIERDFDFFMRYVAVKIKSNNLTPAIDFLKSTWEDVVPNRSFEFTFLDDNLNQLYKSEEAMGRVLSAFSALAVFIACLGLFALASFTAEQRTKEIGIRKVLGATSWGTTGLLTKEFMNLVILSNVIAYPLAYLVISTWLDGFAYRTSISFALFVFASLTAGIVALLTVGFQAHKASVQDPVKSLKSE